ncbi:MAG: PorT family protein, partial [Muribaculaceae bacterium]|nr:PorT family protein [Muribaculaceae bacterium]
MKDKWLTDLHDQMEGFEMDEPIGLWDDIECRVSPVRPVPPRLVIWKRIASIAAVAILAIVTIHLSLHDTGSMIADMPITALSSNPTQAMPTADSHTLPAPTGFNTPTNTISKHTPTIIASNSSITDKANVAEIANSTEAEVVTDSVPTAGSVPESLTDRIGTKHTYAYQNPSHPSRHRITSHGSRISMGIFTANGTNASLNNMHPGDPNANAVTGANNNAQWCDRPMLGMMLYNKDEAITTTYRHRLPVRAGLSFTYRISSRIGIESGLAYTNLTSDMQDGTEINYYSGRQILHYIGIPLNLKCRIASWRNFDVYGSAGMMAEKCVAGAIRSEYVLNNQSDITDTDALTEKPF